MLPRSLLLRQATRASRRVIFSHSPSNHTRIQPTFVLGARSSHLRASASPSTLLVTLSTKSKPSTIQTPPSVQFQRMSSTQRDVSHLSDISQSKMADDGSYNRKPSTFRDVIEKGGKYEPEKGEFLPLQNSKLKTNPISCQLQGDTTSMFLMPALGLTERSSRASSKASKISSGSPSYPRGWEPTGGPSPKPTRFQAQETTPSSVQSTSKTSISRYSPTMRESAYTPLFSTAMRYPYAPGID